MDLFLNDKVVVVTGGAGAIGKAICAEFLANGATVVLAGTTESRLIAAVDELKNISEKVAYIRTDVSSRESAENMVSFVVEKFGRLDCLINNAGINGGPDQRKPIHEYDDNLWNSILAVDLTGIYNCSKPAIQQMICQGGGNIINITSITGLTPLRLQCAFAAAKAGVVNLTKAMALEVANDNIRVNAIAPGSIIFEGTRKLFYADPVKAEALLSHIPQHRPGDPEDIAGMACMLASDRTKYMTGSIVTIDGGWTCGYTRDF